MKRSACAASIASFSGTSISKASATARTRADSCVRGRLPARFCAGMAELQRIRHYELVSIYSYLFIMSSLKHHNMMITAAQCRMARAALKIGVLKLAAMAKVATSTITRLEAGEELKPRTVEAIQTALEKAGVEFTNGNKPGVRLK